MRYHNRRTNGNKRWTSEIPRTLILLIGVFIGRCEASACFLHNGCKTGRREQGWRATKDRGSADTISPSLPSSKPHKQNNGSWMSTGSLGSFLLQQKKREDKLKNKKRKHGDDLYGGVSIRANRTKTLKEDKERIHAFINENEFKELDGSVTDLSEDNLQDMQVLSQEFKVPTRASSYPAATPANIPKIEKGRGEQPVSDEHLTQITHDIAHLAASTASTISSIPEWRLFCQDHNGGFAPLFQNIREGARCVTFHKEELPSQKEEIFRYACTATRALRDLCALSQDSAAVVTDAVVHSDAVMGGGSVMEDLVSLLLYVNHSENVVSSTLIARDKAGRMGSLWHRQALILQSRRRCRLYILQLLLSMSMSSDAAVWTMRSTPSLIEAVRACSSFEPLHRQTNKIRSSLTSLWNKITPSRHRLFHNHDTHFQKSVQGAANQLLAALGYNVWVPKTSGQRGLRILCLDGGGTRGMAAITTLQNIVNAMGGIEVCDTFDLIAGTSTGAIIAFLVGLKRETSRKARKRYDALIQRIFVKSALSAPMLVFTTASYDETPFMEVMTEILGKSSMLESRRDPSVPLVFAVSSKMSSLPTGLCLFRNYNYNGGEQLDKFVVDPGEAREALGLEVEYDLETVKRFVSPKQIATMDSEKKKKRMNQGVMQTVEGSRHPGSFRVNQSIALRASTAAPTVFKPLLMGGELFCDGGIVASNPAAVAIHEARILFPDLPIELLVSCGTGGFVEVQNSPRVGWDAIISQIVNSACDGEQTHHILEDILGQEEGATAQLGKSHVSKTRYFRLNPLIGMPDDFPIDGTDPEKLEELCKITNRYLGEEEQRRKLDEIRDILHGKRDSRWRRLWFWR